jgi:hypothetical protein
MPIWIIITLAAQISAMWLIFFNLYRHLERRSGRPPIHDLGVMWCLLLLLYSTLPVVTWILEGGSLPFYYGRLSRLDPQPDDHVRILNIAIFYLVAFVISYRSTLKKRLIRHGESPPKIPPSVLIPSVCVVVFAFGFDFFLKASGIIRSASDYADSYLAIASLPPLIGQIYKFTSALSNFATGVLFLAAMQNIKRYRFLIVAYLAFLLLSYDVTGHRSQLAIGLFKAALCWHVTQTPFKNSTIAIGMAVALIAFNLLGFYRGVLEGAGSNMGLGVSELLMVYGNAIELLQIARDTTIEVPFSAQFGEFFAFLPSQVLGPEKSSLDAWFAMTYHASYSEIGGGLAFGALAQAIIGVGELEAAIRGIILGYLFAQFTNKARKSQKNWWMFPIQIYLLSYMYYSIRSTTFSFVGAIFQTIAPAIIFYIVIERLQRRPKSRAHEGVTGE